MKKKLKYLSPWGNNVFVVCLVAFGSWEKSQKLFVKVKFDISWFADDANSIFEIQIEKNRNVMRQQKEKNTEIQSKESRKKIPWRLRWIADSDC